MKYLWYILLALMALTAGALEVFEGLDGLLETNTQTEFYVEYALVAATLLCVWLALRMIRSNNVLRMLMLFTCVIINTVVYHLYMDSSFLYLALIALAGFPFVKAKIES